MGAICIKCMNPDAIVKLHLDGSRDLECGECGEVFKCEDVRAAMDAMKNWEKLLPLIEAFPEQIQG